MNRRQFAGVAAAAAASAAASAGAAAPRTSMGVATTCYMTVWRPRETYQFLEHCAALGAGGIQAGLSSPDGASAAKLRARAEQLGMFVEVMAPLARGDGAAFEAIVKAARQAGARCIRVGALSGRRYESFASMADWQTFVAESVAGIERALPVLARHKMPMAVENHKDWTLDEFLALLKRYSSEWLGVCLDTGNNIALLDDPYETVEKLSPFTISTHIKDMGVALSGDGFLLSEVPLGDGFLDLRRIVDTIRRHRPKVPMTLEMITRNPLAVPCLTDRYWATFGDRGGIHLARTLAMVKRHEKPGRPLPGLDGLPPEAQRQLEADNVVKCLAYAREKLGMTAR